MPPPLWCTGLRKGTEVSAGGSRPQRSHALATGQPAWPNRAAFHFKISSVNRGDCVAGIPAAPSIPSEVGFTHPHDRGCWKGFGRSPWTTFACFLLEAVSRSCGPDSFWLLGSYVICSSEEEAWCLQGGGEGAWGEGPEGKQTIPNPVLVASQIVPGRLGAASLA